MIRTIGLIELNSIAKGIEVADFMIKAAEVNLLKANSICPGKYIVLISGDVAAVKASIEVGNVVGREFVVDKLILSNVHPQLIKAINGTVDINEFKSLGVLEFFSIATSIVAADTAAKSALIDLIDVRLGLGIGGKSYITLTGDVSSVTEAVEAGAISAKNTGMLVSKVVIPSPRKELFNELL
ncbi:BMC domain-containing protein [Maledivibacter halophilus]|uniref:Carboxysome shell and ethanolamine utilization microcompartment protein CcmL/EutN n=1 Tax=Maledivibacter halophilus TaxID=36842 RepID=A0A1T5IGD1_9FIRM|nr:BMC domain-containing protein [Maledivibacter halophilus]SKC38128.1 Carboxysome shell and ethanolamine utilization microcompartment protein CcmL/EutN [Maledivibacter halophilus]